MAVNNNNSNGNGNGNGEPSRPKAEVKNVQFINLRPQEERECDLWDEESKSFTLNRQGSVHAGKGLTYVIEHFRLVGGSSHSQGEKPVERLELVNMKLDAIDTSLSALDLLKVLVLRHNSIKFNEASLEALKSCKSITEFDLYDNKLPQLVAFPLPDLKVLDVSFNKIRKIEFLDHLNQLIDLSLANNKITAIDGLSALKSLTNLELGSNRLREIKGLEALVNLKNLWLGKNKIPKITNMEALTNLRILSLQSNRLTQLEGLDTLVNLEELYLSHNGITRMGPTLLHLKNLKILDLSVNFIEQFENVENLAELEEFWFNDNKIALEHFDRELSKLQSSMKKIQTLYLSGNPLFSDPQYRNKVTFFLPSLTQLDATFVVHNNPISKIQ